MDGNQQNNHASAKFLLKFLNNLNELKSEFDKLSIDEKREVKDAIELGLGIKILSKDF